MVKDPIEIIKDAETEAERIIAEARTAARDIKLKSEKAVFDGRENAVLFAKNESLKDIESGGIIGDNKANQILNDAEKTCEEISASANKNMEKAVKIICERVVKTKCQ
ncbi:MAG: hypothetical protein IJS65_01305 [Clostridia bacterium]|nr:hypothetical protein [Clostridia bacterium]